MLLFRALFFLALFFTGVRLPAQDLQVIGIDSSAFPEIRISVVYKGKSKFDTTRLKISQNNTLLPYTIRESAPGSVPEKGRSVFFLIEASGNTHGKALADLKEGVSMALDNLEAKDLVNVGWFGSMDVDSMSLQLLSEHYSIHHDQIRSDIHAKIKALRDTGHRSDLYKSILDALNYIAGQQKLPPNKLFIVLSTGRNNSTSAISSTDCVSKAREMDVPVYSITYLPSDTTYAMGMMMNRIGLRSGGKNTLARSPGEVINALTDIFFNAPLPASMQEAAYDLIVRVKPENGLNKARIELSYPGSPRRILSVSDGNKGSLIPDDYKLYLWLSIGILAVIVFIMLLINLFSKRNGSRSATAEEPGGEIKADITRAKPALRDIPAVETNTPPSSAAKTAVRQPVILASIGGRTTTFPLTGPEMTIGRHESNTIVLAEQTVTGKHAVIKIQGEEISITDLGSTNGTFVNGERIRSKVIRHGDKLRVGQAELTLKTQ